MGRLRLLQLDLLELEVCLVVVAAVVAPSLVILRVLGHLIQKNLRVVLQYNPRLWKYFWSFLIFRSLGVTLFQLLRGECTRADAARRLPLHSQSWVSEPQLRYHEQRIWALKSDRTHLGTAQRLSLLELEGRLKALNG